MTEEYLYDLFKEHSGFFLEDYTPGKRTDLVAMNRLAELVPGPGDIVSAADHDMIWFGVGAAELAAVATELDIIFLIQHGVMCDESDGLHMHA